MDLIVQTCAASLDDLVRIVLAEERPVTQYHHQERKRPRVGFATPSRLSRLSHLGSIDLLRATANALRPHSRLHTLREWALRAPTMSPTEPVASAPRAGFIGSDCFTFSIDLLRSSPPSRPPPERNFTRGRTLVLLSLSTDPFVFCPASFSPSPSLPFLSSHPPLHLSSDSSVIYPAQFKSPPLTDLLISSSTYCNAYYVVLFHLPVIIFKFIADIR